MFFRVQIVVEALESQQQYLATNQERLYIIFIGWQILCFIFTLEFDVSVVSSCVLDLLIPRFLFLDSVTCIHFERLILNLFYFDIIDKK